MSNYYSKAATGTPSLQKRIPISSEASLTEQLGYLSGVYGSFWLQGTLEVRAETPMILWAVQRLLGRLEALEFRF